MTITQEKFEKNIYIQFLEFLKIKHRNFFEGFPVFEVIVLLISLLIK